MPGLDDAIGKLERIDFLLTKLSSGGKIKINVSVTGGEQLDGAVANLNLLASALKSVGKNDLASALKAGHATAGDVARSAIIDITGLEGKLKAAQDRVVSMQGQWELFGHKLERGTASLPAGGLAPILEKLKGIEAERDKISALLGQMKQVHGMAEGMAGLPQVASAAKAAAVEEKGLASAAGQSAEAIGLQQKLAAAKADAMNKLTTATKGTTAAEKANADATTKAAEASEKAGLLARKIVTDKKTGKVTGTSETFQTQSGSTETIRNNRTAIAQYSALLEWQNKFEEARAQFAGRRESALGGGAARGSQQMIDLLREEEAERQKILTAMKSKGLEESKLYKQEARRAAEMRANTETRQSGLNASEEARRQAAAAAAAAERQKQVTDRLNQSYRDHAAGLDRNVTSGRALATSKEQLINLLNHEAAGYERLARAMAASGRGYDPAALSAEKKANALRAEAGSLQRELDTAKARSAAMTQQAVSDFGRFGGTRKRGVETSGPAGRSVTEVATRDTAGGMRETITLTRRWNAANEEMIPTLTKVSDRLEQKGRSATAAGRSMLNNLATVTAWSLAVGVLYKSLALLSFGAESMAKINAQTARLNAVFRGTQETGADLTATVLRLRDGVLELAAANGRSGDEAMDAAIRWARLGFTQREVLEAVDVSLKAANVAEISTADSAEQLSAIFSAYRLQVSELRVVLNELNSVSNRFNVTNKDLLSGVARSSAIAKAAGISFAELIGIIGAGVGRTGRPGAEFGNAIKSMIVALSNPALQRTLKKVFDFDVKTPRGELKDMSTILNELFIAYQKLGKADQGELLERVGGKQQASRVQAMLDGYVQSQVLAIQAQQDLTSADREGLLIRGTMLSQIQSLSTAFQRLVVNLTNAGRTPWFDFSVLGQLTALIEALAHIMVMMGNVPGVLGVAVALFAAMAFRIGQAALRMADGATKGNILTRTIQHLAEVWAMFGQAVALANGQLVRSNTLMAGARGASNASIAGAVGGRALAPAAVGAAGAGAARAAGGGLVKGLGTLLVGTIFSEGMLVAIASIAAVEVALWGFNKVMRMFSSEGENAADKLGIYNKQLEKTRALLSASDMSGRLAATLGKSIPDLQASNPKAARQAIEQFSAIAYSDKDDPRGERRQALKQELNMLVASGRIKEAQARLAEIEARFMREKASYASMEVRERTRLLNLQQTALAGLDAEIKARRASGKDTVLQEAKRVEVLKQIQSINGEITRAFGAAYNADEQPISEARKQQSADVKSNFAGMKQVSEAFPLVGPDEESEKIERHIALLERQQEMLNERITIAKSDASAAKGNAEAKYNASLKEWSGLDQVRQGHEAVRREEAKAKAAFYNASKWQAATENNPFVGPGDRRQLAANTEKARARWGAAIKATDAFEGPNEAAIARNAELEKTMGVQRKTADDLIGYSEKKIEGLSDEVRLQQEVKDEELRQLEIAKEYARVQDAISAGKRDAKNKSVRFQVGTNETEQLFSEMAGIGMLARNNAGFQLAGNAGADEQGLLRDAARRRDEAQNAGNAAGAARAEAEMLQLGNRLVEIQLSLEERRYRLARDITNERAKEAQEASKSLMLATREEQVRAALIKKFLEQQGGKGFSSEQFQFFSKETQESVQKFNSSALPPEIETKSRQLQKEYELLEAGLAGLVAAVTETRDGLRAIKLTTVPAPGGAGADQDGPGAPPVFAGNVNLQFNEQFDRAIQVIGGVVEARLNEQMAQMNARFNAFMSRGRTGAAQAAGAETLNSSS